MPRRHWIELEDQHWFPATLRNYMTDVLNFQIDHAHVYAPAIPLLAKALRETGDTRLLDLCSGGGGPIPTLAKGLHAAGLDVTITMSDLFPNVDAFSRVAEATEGVEFITAPLDATDVPREQRAFRTMFTCLHHFRPEAVRDLLADAARKRVGIGVFDLVERRPLFLATVIPLSVLGTFLITPFLRPFRLARLAMTYVVPALPCLVAFDGFMSGLRAYEPEDLRAILDTLKVPGYRWETGRTSHPLLPMMHITWVVGVPEPLRPQAEG